jgi:Ca2+-binding EF-hand superfamily protein
MKTLTQSLVAAVLGMTTLTLVAQEGKRPGGPEGRPHRGSPMVAILDVNHDGVIDAGEMANASAVLAKLDKNNDGQLTVEELRPAPPKNGDAAPAVPNGHEGRPGGGPEGRPHGAPPIVAALDANHDGVIDASELANAAAALASLDKNKDGQLTVDELRPTPPAGAGGEGDRGHGPRGKRGGRPAPDAGN